MFQLHDDCYEAFFSAIAQRHENSEWEFIVQRPTAQTPVPPRVCSLDQSSHKPLFGLRFGIKDVFPIKGLKTSTGSRSYYQLYPPRSQISATIKTLIELGSILVGKTKNAQFINGEDPQERIDYSCPWSPRGKSPNCARNSICFLCHPD